MSLEQESEELRNSLINSAMDFRYARMGCRIDSSVEILGMLQTIQRSIDTALSKIDDVSDHMYKLEHTVQNTDKKFKACAEGFYQIREACTTLREELSEASGTLIEATYN